MMNYDQSMEYAKRFSEKFWKNNGKTIQKKPQNPIAARQALYNKEDDSYDIMQAESEQIE